VIWSFTGTAWAVTKSAICYTTADL